MATKPMGKLRQPGNAYNIFILVVTVMSLVIMVSMLLPLAPQTMSLVKFYDNEVCIIFLVDFILNFLGAERKSDFFFKERGWLDLLGSIPSFGLFQYASLLRLFRLSRLARITRLLRGQRKKELVRDVVNNRSQYAAFITVLMALIVLSVASVLVLEFESTSPDANIKTGWDSFWYSVVTITTVGYGDRYPVTVGGRITAMFIMFMGVGIIGALASILASVLVGSSSTPTEEEAPVSPPADNPPATRQDIEKLQSQLAALQEMVARMPDARMPEAQRQAENVPVHNEA